MKKIPFHDALNDYVNNDNGYYLIPPGWVTTSDGFLMEELNYCLSEKLSAYCEIVSEYAENVGMSEQEFRVALTSAGLVSEEEWTVVDLYGELLNFTMAEKAEDVLSSDQYENLKSRMDKYWQAKQPTQGDLI